MCVHALHTVHALPDLRVAAGRLRDGASVTCRPLPASRCTFPTQRTSRRSPEWQLSPPQGVPLTLSRGRPEWPPGNSYRRHSRVGPL